MIVLDTSILSLTLRRRPAAAHPELVSWFSALLVRERLLVPGIVLQEVLSGIPDPSLVERLRGRLAAFPRLLADEEDHLRAADFRTRCQVRGVAAGTCDCLIAALAVRHGAAVLATDGDYPQMAPHCPGLRLRRPLT